MRARKPVAAVCHAPAVLLDAKGEDGGPLVSGRDVTGFSNSEEAGVQLTDVVPYLLERTQEQRRPLPESPRLGTARRGQWPAHHRAESGVVGTRCRRTAKTIVAI